MFMDLAHQELIMLKNVARKKSFAERNLRPVHDKYTARYDKSIIFLR